MKSGLKLSQHALLLATLLVANKLFAAEPGPTTRNPLPAPPTRAASVAENRAATDAGSPRPANGVTATDLPALPPGVVAGNFLVTGRVPGTTAAHTASDIPVSAFGLGASLFTGVMDNTDVFFKTMQVALNGVKN